MEKYKGNDLKYNVYVRKMEKLVRRDMGIDLEGYREHINNIIQLRKLDKNFEPIEHNVHDENIMDAYHKKKEEELKETNLFADSVAGL